MYEHASGAHRRRCGADSRRREKHPPPARYPFVVHNPPPAMRIASAAAFILVYSNRKRSVLPHDLQILLTDSKITITGQSDSVI